MRYLAAFATLLLCTVANAQSVKQSGSVTPNHIPYWITNGTIGDGGTASDSPISSIGITNNGGPGFCISSGRITAAGRQQMCFSVALSGSAVISLQNYGTASPEGINFKLNGVNYPFPGALSSLTINTTPVSGGVNGDCLYVNGSVVGQTSCGTTAITALTGDVTATGPGSVAATLAVNQPNVHTWAAVQTFSVPPVTAAKFVTISSSGSLSASADILVDTTAGDITLTLPAVSTQARYVIKKKTTDANNVIVAASGGATIDAGTALVFNAAYATYTIESDTLEWWTR